MSKLDYYLTYYRNLSPSEFEVKKENEKIVIKNIMKTPKKANAGAYLAIAQQAKGVAPNAVDALDRKIARKLDGPKYSDAPLFAEKGIMIKGIGARKIQNAIKENLSKNT